MDTGSSHAQSLLDILSLVRKNSANWATGAKLPFAFAVLIFITLSHSLYAALSGMPGFTRLPVYLAH